METNYTLKRLKLIWPIFAILMLGSFLVNAQVQYVGIDVEHNNIYADMAFCDELTATITGTQFGDPALGNLSVQSTDNFSSATITISWQWSPTGAENTWQPLSALPAGLTATPVTPAPGSYIIVGVTPVNVVADVVGHYDLYVEVDQDIHFQRVVNVQTSGTASANIGSNSVFLEYVGAGFVCEDNDIGFDLALTEDELGFCEESATVTIYGFEYGQVCDDTATPTVVDVEYRWEYSTDGGANWYPTGVTTVNLVDYYVDVDGTMFRRWAFPVDTKEECYSNTVTVYLYGELWVPIIDGPTILCLQGQYANATYTIINEQEGVVYYWEISEEYGSMVAGNVGPQVAINWDTVTCPGDTAWVQVTAEITPNLCLQMSEKFLVVIYREPEANILTPDGQEICGAYGEVNFDFYTDEAEPHLVFEDGDEVYAYVVELNADFTEDCWETGQWTKTCGPDDVVFVVAAGTDPIDPFDAASWELVEDTYGVKDIYAVVFRVPGEGRECFDGIYTFQWTEYGQGNCGDDSAEVTIFFYEPILEVDADLSLEENYDTTCQFIYGLNATPATVYCEETECGVYPSVPEGTWTVVDGPEGAPVAFVVAAGSGPIDPWDPTTWVVDANDPNAVAVLGSVVDDEFVVGTYGEYTFRWTLTNGPCADVYDDVTILFEKDVMADAGEDQHVCGQFQTDRKSVWTTLEGSYELFDNPQPIQQLEDGVTGKWALKLPKADNKPPDSNDPIFLDDTDPNTKVFVTSFGTYTLTWTVETENGICGDVDEVAIHFYPGVKDITITPAEQEVCTLQTNVAVNADFDKGLLPSDGQNYYLIGTATIYKWNGLTWDVYEDANLTHTGTIGVASSTFNQPTGTLTLTGANKTKIARSVKVEVEDYGRYKIEWDVKMYGNDGTLLDCYGDDEAIIDFYWKPIADIFPDGDVDLCYDIDNLGDHWVTVTGNVPVLDGWGLAYGLWTVTVDGEEVEGILFRNPATGDTIPVPQYLGPQVVGQKYLTTTSVDILLPGNGEYEIMWTVINGPWDLDPPLCYSEDWITYGYWEAPDAGDDSVAETCGKLVYGADEDGCYSWDAETVYRYTLAGEAPTANTKGVWTVSGPGTVWFNGKKLGDAGYATETAKFDPMVEVSIPGVYTFTWTLTNKGYAGCPDVSVHVVEFLKTPEPRQLIPISVEMVGGKMVLDADYNAPFAPCYTCEEYTQFYMLSGPNNNALFTVTGGKSILGPSQSVLWHTIGGAQVGAVENKPIEGGMIVKTYALANDGMTLVSTGTVHHHKHFIVEIAWGSKADVDPGVINVEEWYSITDCSVIHKFEVNKVEQLVISGPEQVYAFSSEDNVVNDGDYIYTVDYVPGTVYEWIVKEGTILGGWYYQEDGVYDMDEYDVTEDFKGLDLVKIHVEFAGGPADLIEVVIEGYCDERILFPVKVIQNTFAGQLKYWNEVETFIPTPYKMHKPSNNFDYFYVHLFDVTEILEEMVAADAKLVSIYDIHELPMTLIDDMIDDEDLVPTIKKIFVDPLNPNLQSYFKFEGLNVNKRYLMRLVDGGFYHLVEAGAVAPAQNYLSFTYTWNRWDGIGVNPVDALAILQMGLETDLHSLGAVGQTTYWWVGENDDTPEYGFLTNAVADVNDSGSLTITDAYHVLNRYVGTFGQFQNNVPNFQAAGRFVSGPLPQKTFGLGDDVTGFSHDNDLDLMFGFGRKGNINYVGTQDPNDFYYQSSIFDLKPANNFINLYLTAAGDVNSRTSVPGPGEVTQVVKSDIAGLDYTGAIEAKIGDEIVIPIRVNESANIAAMGIGLTFNNSLIEVLEVDYEIANFSNKDGFIRVAAVDENGTYFAANESILNIRARIIGEMNDAQLFALEPITEFADRSLQELDVNLNTDLISTNSVTSIGGPAVANLTIGNYPNPFRTSTTIEYSLPEAGKVTLVVFNNVGQVVATLVDENQSAGQQSVELNRSDLGNGDGMFIYRITVKGQSKTYTGTGNVMLVK